MTTVKICGIRTLEHALAATTAGADLLGLVFAPSSRQVTIAEAVALAQAVRQHTTTVQLVGLFVNTPTAAINRVAVACGLDVVQLSGDEPAAHAAAVNVPIIKALRMNGTANEAEWLELATAQRVRLLVDAHVAGAYGGTGVSADWDAAARYAQHHPLLLAGGLTPVNVAAAIAHVRPWGVDVSSGVETDGIKDVRKIADFISAARSVVG